MQRKVIDVNLKTRRGRKKDNNPNVRTLLVYERAHSMSQTIEGPEILRSQSQWVREG